MAKLTWDETGERTYETGVDHGVLYIPNSSGVLDDGVAWNGLVTVTETPSGAEANAQYADNVKYLNLYSAEDFTATIEAFTYPDEFAQFDGLGEPTDGVVFGQQSRRPFGLSYRTRLGNDLQGDAYGHKLHLLYGATASPSEKAYSTVNDSPEAITFSWELSTVAVPVDDIAGKEYRPTSLVVIDSTKVANSANLETLETILYGTTGINPRLPLPNEVYTILNAGVTNITSITIPTKSGNNITITEGTGIIWKANDVVIPLDEDGTTIYAITADTIISAHPAPGYNFSGVFDTDWFFEHT